MAGPGVIVGVCWSHGYPALTVDGGDRLRMYVGGVKVGESDTSWGRLYTGADNQWCAKTFAYAHAVAAAGTYSVVFKHYSQAGGTSTGPRGYGVLGVALT